MVNVRVPKHIRYVKAATDSDELAIFVLFTRAENAKNDAYGNVGLNMPLTILSQYTLPEYQSS